MRSVLSGEHGEWRRRVKRRPSAQQEPPDVGLLSRQARAPLGVCVPTSTSFALQQPLLWFGHGEQAARREKDTLGYENLNTGDKMGRVVYFSMETHIQHMITLFRFETLTHRFYYRKSMYKRKCVLTEISIIILFPCSLHFCMN